MLHHIGVVAGVKMMPVVHEVTKPERYATGTFTTVLRTRTAGACSRGAAVAALALGVAIAFGLLALAGRPGAGLLGCLAAAAMAAGVAAVAKRQIGGYTGDVLGAAQQAAETAFFLAVAAG